MKILILCLGILAAAPSRAADIVSYQIRGGTAAELIAQMKQLGPRGFWAYTDLRYTWNYNYQNAGGRCRITSVNVAEKITITMPAWSNRGAGKSCLNENWDRMIAKLSEHEQGHVQRGNGVRQRIHAAIMALPPVAACADLGRAADAAGRAEIDRMQAEQDAYDRQTNHGITQGTTLREC